MPANQSVTIHGTKPDNFYTAPVESKISSIYGLGFPLGKDKTTGGFFRKVSNIEAIRNAVTQLLLTEPGERLMLPRFGCRLRRYLFQPLDEATFEGIKREILYSFNKYIVGATVTKLLVEPTNIVGPSGGNSLRVVLTLKLNVDDLTLFDVEAIIK